MNVGDYVIVSYSDAYYPGEVTSASVDGTVQVSVMQRSGMRNWKWPFPADKLDYNITDIVQKIAVPISISRRGIFEVKEMEAFDVYSFCNK